MTQSDVDILQDLLGLSEAEADALWMATLWADHLVAIARFGYPKDNHIPAPLTARLNDPTYLQHLLDAWADEDGPGDELEGAARRRVQGVLTRRLRLLE